MDYLKRLKRLIVGVRKYLVLYDDSSVIHTFMHELLKIIAEVFKYDLFLRKENGKVMFLFYLLHSYLHRLKQRGMMMTIITMIIIIMI